MKVEPGASAYSRVVVDTNVLLSAFLRPTGAPTEVVARLLRDHCLVMTKATFAELETRIWKPKFDRYLPIEMRHRLLHDVDASAYWVEVPNDIAARRICRDPDDDTMLHAALAAQTRRLITSDDDLLVLGNADDVTILAPRAALDELDRHS